MLKNILKLMFQLYNNNHLIDYLDNNFPLFYQNNHLILMLQTTPMNKFLNPIQFFNQFDCVRLNHQCIHDYY